MLNDLIRIALENHENDIEDALIDAIARKLDFDSIAEKIVLRYEREIASEADDFITKLFDLPPF